MAHRKRVVIAYGWIGFGVLATCGILTAGFLQWLLEEAHFIAWLVLMALCGVAWFGGSLQGHEMQDEARKLREHARSDLNAAQGKERAVERKEEDIKFREKDVERAENKSRAVAQSLARQRDAINAENDDMMKVIDEKNRGEDLRFIDSTHALPLEKRIEVSLRVGTYPHEPPQSYVRRRQEFLKRRVGEWKKARRSGVLLLPLVEAQRGLCGDPDKDPSHKGCGTYLYSFPVTAIHIDHIRPQSKGGSDHPDNLQAPCSFCNTSAGNRA